jgi:hypothetical protein
VNYSSFARRQGFRSALMGEAGAEDATPPQDVLERLKDFGQEQTLALWKELSSNERGLLIKDLEVFNYSLIFNRSIIFASRTPDKHLVSSLSFIYLIFLQFP